MKLLPLEEHVCNNTEYNQRDNFLYDFELHQRERPSIIDKTDTICRHQKAVFYAGNQPREANYGNQGPVRRDAGLIEFQVPVPSKCHKDIAAK